MTDTHISWTDETWNPTTGCDRVSAGCDNCYALTMAKRLKGMGSAKYQTDGDPRTSGPGFGIAMHPDVLTVPLSWRKPRRVFVNSMSDLFHDGISDAFIAEVFSVMARTPQHTYQILTKRHGRMRSLLNRPSFRDNLVHLAPWPLPNVWLGVSVEDQQRADLRIPALLETPAAIRWLSCEPLLGPVDLAAWMLPISPVPVGDAPGTWADWAWPDWVPAEVRTSIEEFWGPRMGRGPKHWMRNMREQGAPAFGATVLMNDGFRQNPDQVVGRYVHAWNNIGRLVLADDSNREFAYTSFGSNARRSSQPINWVVVGGESGRDHREMDVRSLTRIVDQARAADVPTWVKQDSGPRSESFGRIPAEYQIREFPVVSR